MSQPSASCQFYVGNILVTVEFYPEDLDRLSPTLPPYGPTEIRTPTRQSGPGTFRILLTQMKAEV